MNAQAPLQVDQSFLDWPFFTDTHKAYARKLRLWAAQTAQHLPHPEHDTDVDACCRTWVEQLAQGGWLEAAVDDLDVRTLCLSRETLAFHDGLADFAFAMQGLGSGPISLFGTSEQKARYLPYAAQGKRIAAFALSESEAGSDVASLQTHATRHGDGFILNGEKMWISNGGIADYYLVFARSTRAPGTRGLSAFIVDAASSGFDVSERLHVIAPHPLGRLTFHNCYVPYKNLLGHEGEGFKIAMATLDVFRSTVGAAALGFARRALAEALHHTQTRHLFGAPLAQMQLTQSKLADMALEIDASALLIYRAAWCKDSGQARVTKEAAMAKLYATEAAQRIIDAAVQLHGGRGVQRGEVVEHLYRDIRALRIYEGASEVQQQIIARQLLSATPTPA